MSVTLEKPPVPAPAPQRKSPRRAWVAVLAAPFVTVLALVLGFGGIGDVALLLIPIPIVVGFTLGFRAARSGSRSGALAAATELGPG